MIDAMTGIGSIQARMAELALLTGTRTAGTGSARLGAGSGFADVLGAYDSATRGAARVNGLVTGALTGTDATTSGSTSGTSRTGSLSGGTAARTGSGTAGTTTVSGRRVLDIAEKYVGVPYVWGGTNPRTGLDCSGLTQLVYRQVGIDLPRVSRDQAKVGKAVSSLADARPGDLLFFNSPVTHVGIYVGEGKMLDAPRRGRTVGVHDIFETPSRIRRVLPDPATAAGTSGSTTATGSAAVGGPYGELFTRAGKRYGVDPALLSAVAKAESAYDPSARSSAGARGLMQLMPATARALGVDPLDPTEAVDGAARLLADHLRRYGGRVDLALAAYNAGPGAVATYGGVPPYDETRTYVSRVTRYWEALR